MFHFSIHNAARQDCTHAAISQTIIKPTLGDTHWLHPAVNCSRSVATLLGSVRDKLCTSVAVVSSHCHLCNELSNAPAMIDFFPMLVL